MARQRVLTESVKSDIDGDKQEYNLVRLTDIHLEIGQKFDEQRMHVTWAVGRVVTFKDQFDQDVTTFERCPFNGKSGSKIYTNAPPFYAFGIFLQKVLPLGVGPFLDQIFTDLEAEGAIKPGKQEDYGLAPGS